MILFLLIIIICSFASVNASQKPFDSMNNYPRRKKQNLNIPQYDSLLKEFDATVNDSKFGLSSEKDGNSSFSSTSFDYLPSFEEENEIRNLAVNFRNLKDKKMHKTDYSNIIKFQELNYYQNFRNINFYSEKKTDEYKLPKYALVIIAVLSILVVLSIFASVYASKKR